MGLKVLVAEDSNDIAAVVAFGVRMIWPDSQVMIARSGAEALASFAADTPDLVILDVSMPPPDGFEVCRQIRMTSRVPILMLTVHNTTVDKVRALDLGADDYLTKPFDHLELLARLRALVRRSSQASMVPEQTFVAGDLSLNFATHEVRVAGQNVQLTSTEYRLLEELVRHAGTVVSHRYLLEQVWGPRYIGDSQYLKVFIRRLRHKLGDAAAQQRYIQTEWGIGYRFVG
jgi:DNA-binding response OmpR family regulator